MAGGQAFPLAMACTDKAKLWLDLISNIWIKVNFLFEQ